MSRFTVTLHEETLDHLDCLITNAYEAKENYLLKRYEEAAANLDEVSGARKRAEVLINEMWE